jgi:hypothetical protein
VSTVVGARVRDVRGKVNKEVGAIERVTPARRRQTERCQLGKKKNDRSTIELGEGVTMSWRHCEVSTTTGSKVRKEMTKQRIKTGESEDKTIFHPYWQTFEELSYSASEVSSYSGRF